MIFPSASRQAAKSLLLSTVIGGVGAIVAWQVLSVWPSLVMYVLLVGLGRHSGVTLSR